MILIHTDPIAPYLLEVFWLEDKRCFMLLSGSGYERRSAVTDVEDVSYVCSPYIPLCVCSGDSRNKLKSNAFLAQEAVELLRDPNRARSFATATGVGHNVRDKLEELITASGIKIMVAEWIPFGANQIRNLNQRLGSASRVTGGLFTAIVDTMPTTTTFMHKVTNIGNLISIIDHTTCGHVNFSADVYFQESPGILQIEEFGVHVEHSGMILYGVEVESVMDRLKENISLDHLARLLVDVHQDSSLIAENLLNNYQRNLLETLYNGSPNSRPKYNVIVCETLTPFLPAAKYLDKSDYEGEITQVIGEVQMAHDLGPRDVLIIGRLGMIVAGRHTEENEAVICDFLSLAARDHMMNTLYQRTFKLADDLFRIRKLIEKFDEDPRSLDKIRGMEAKTSRDLLVLKELLLYLEESLAHVKKGEPPAAAVPAMLYEKLHMSESVESLANRIHDMKKNLDGGESSLKALQDLARKKAENEEMRVQQEIAENTKGLEEIFKANERASSSLNIMQIILAGSLAFDIVSRRVCVCVCVCVRVC